MFPVAAGANGQPPRPPRLASSTRAPAVDRGVGVRDSGVARIVEMAAQRHAGHRLPHPAEDVGHLARHADADRVRDRDLEGLASATSRAISTTRSGATSPSNGQPKAPEIVTAAGCRRHARRPQSRASSRIDSALVTPWLRRLNSSVVNTTMPISRQPAARGAVEAACGSARGRCSSRRRGAAATS